jgi:hypothetical protein
MASAKVTYLTFIRAEISYGADDPFRYECRINEDPEEVDRVRGPYVRGHGKTPSEAFDAALMPFLERKHEREQAQDEKDEQARKARAIKLIRHPHVKQAYRAEVDHYTFDVLGCRHNKRRAWRVEVDQYHLDTLFNLHDVRLTIAAFARERAVEEKATQEKADV